MRKINVVYTVGIPGSGKSFWAKRQTHNMEPGTFFIASRDEQRAIFQGIPGDRPIWKDWNWKNEKIVTEDLWARICYAIESNEKLNTIFITDTNMNLERIDEHLRKLKTEFADSIEFQKQIKVIYAHVDEAITRDLQRDNPAGEKIVRGFWKRFLDLSPRLLQYCDLETEEKISKYAKVRTTNTSNKPNCIILDVDGTVALHQGLRTPFEWDKVDLDAPRKEIIAMVDGMVKEMSAKVIVVSGRDGVCRGLTAQWLIDNGVKFSELYMRPEKDSRPDTVIKEEIFFNHIFNRYNVVAMIDDRPKVCRHMRDLNISVIAVADPHVEF